MKPEDAEPIKDQRPLSEISPIFATLADCISLSIAVSCYIPLCTVLCEVITLKQRGAPVLHTGGEGGTNHKSIKKNEN